MNLLDRLERRVEQLVEGVFARAFKAAPHPVDVARALARLMEERALVSLSRTYAPNEFRVSLNAAEFEAWSPVAADIAHEIEAYLQNYAAEHPYVLPGPLQVTIHSDEDVAAGEFRADAALSAMDGHADGPEIETSVFHAPQPVGPSGALVTESGRRYPMSDRPLTVGRGEGCEIALQDAAASREHARVERSEDGYVLTDLGSKNGSYVNGERIERRLLRPGDRIRIGETIFEFREESA